MPKNLEQLVDEVLNKLCEQDFYRFKSGNNLALELAREDMVTFLEAQIRLAYREGAEGVKNNMLQKFSNLIKTHAHSAGCGEVCRGLIEAEAFLSTLTDV